MKLKSKLKTSKQSRSVVARLGAIAHEGRLALLRRLIQAGPDGVSAGDLATFAGLNAPTASAQLGVLRSAGLISSTRIGRQIIYCADYGAMTDLLSYLMADCCGGNQKICAPLAAQLEQAS